MNTLELVLEGRVSTDSGKLLVIDPCYLKEFDMSFIDILYETDEKNGLQPLIDKMEKLLAQVERGIPLDRAEVDGLLEGRHTVKEKRKEAASSFLPPYFAQSKNYVIFNNLIGDGCYPVIATPRRHYILYNFPIIAGKTHYTPDLAQMPRELLGFSSVDSGIQVIIDPATVEVKSTVSQANYCIFECKPGTYACRFLKDKSKVAIRCVQT